MYSRIEPFAQINSVECHTTRYLFIAGVQVQNTVICLTNPNYFGNPTAEWGLGGIARLDIKEVPSRRSFRSSPIVGGRREESTILQGQWND